MVLGYKLMTEELRQGMLREAVEAIRALWSGETVTRRGRWITVEDARLYDRPATPPEMAIACGPDLERHVRQIQRYVDAGFDHLILVQAGPDQEGFLRFFERDLAPQLERLAA